MVSGMCPPTISTAMRVTGCPAGLQTLADSSHVRLPVERGISPELGCVHVRMWECENVPPPPEARPPTPA